MWGQSSDDKNVFYLTMHIEHHAFIEVVTSFRQYERADLAYDPIQAAKIAWNRIRQINKIRQHERRKGIM